MDFFFFLSVTFLIHYQYEFRKSTCKKSVIFPNGLHVAVVFIGYNLYTINLSNPRKVTCCYDAIAPVEVQM